MNNVYTLLHRAYALCNSWQSLHEEIQFLVNFFKVNAYSEHLIYKIIRRFLGLKMDNNAMIQRAEASKLVFYQKIPFLNDPSCKYLRQELKVMIRQILPSYRF